MASLVRAIYQMNTKSSGRKFKGQQSFALLLLLAVVKKHYLRTFPVPVHSMEILCNSAAEPDKDLLKLPMQGFVQAKSANQWQWRNC